MTELAEITVASCAAIEVTEDAIEGDVADEFIQQAISGRIAVTHRWEDRLTKQPRRRQ